MYDIARNSPQKIIRYMCATEQNILGRGRTVAVKMDDLVWFSCDLEKTMEGESQMSKGHL